MLVTARRVVLRNLLYLLSPSSNSLSLVQCVESPTCDMLQTGVGQFATGGQVEVLEFDQAGQD